MAVIPNRLYDQKKRHQKTYQYQEEFYGEEELASVAEHQPQGSVTTPTGHQDSNKRAEHDRC